MATLVLTAAGAAIGGPIGAAIGGSIGQYVDRTVLLPPKRREGPRLTELRLQTSSYGTQIPKLFGTMRVAGTVIWATDLIETRSNSRAGKGQPSVTGYSYSASFAVLLSARPIRGVGRIWAEGKLLRGAAGDWKTPTGFRLHCGEEDQPADPLIVSATGAGLAPAHRGCAYAVFEGLQLADFGNRIPSLTFEVMADGGEVTAGEIAASLAPEAEGNAGPRLGGFAAAGGSLAAVLQSLATLGGGWWAEEGARLTLRDQAPDAIGIEDTGFAATGREARRARTTAPLHTVPRVLAVSHYDPARELQTGVQRVRRPGAGTREERIEVPAVLTATGAKERALAMMLRAEAERTQRVVSLGLEGLAIGPGQAVTVKGDAGPWRVVSASTEGLVTQLTLVPLSAPRATPVTADSGRPVRTPDQEIGRTIVVAFELPPLDDAVLTTPRLAVVAAGTRPGWRRAALLYSLDGGTSWLSGGVTGAPGVIGTLIEKPGAGSPLLIDMRSAVDVRLTHEGMLLAEADDRQLDAGANLAMVGDELMQFGRAEPLGGNRWRLSRLLGGRGGTERAIGRQQPGDRFVLIEADAMQLIDVPLAAMGAIVPVMASGVGDDDRPVTATAPITGISVLPPAPAGLSVVRGENGSMTIRWIRRSRAGWRWLDGVDVPLAEEAERYSVTLDQDGRRIERETGAPMLALSVEFAGSTVVSVRQRGTYGESPENRWFLEGGKQ